MFMIYDHSLLQTGLISDDIFLEDRPLVYECNMKCKCWNTCSQRVVQHGIKVQLQLYRTENKGTGGYNMAWSNRLFKGELNPKIKFVLFERTLKITE